MRSFVGDSKRKASAKPMKTCRHQSESAQMREAGPNSTIVPDGIENQQANDSGLTASDHAPHTSAPQISTSPSPDCKDCQAEKKAAKVYRWKLMFGLLLPFMLASLDLTIVSTALPSIAGYFDKLSQLNWIVTAFTLASTSFIPAAGQLADVFGRYAVLQSAMVLVIIGSTLAASAQTWALVLLGRGLQGLAAAGINNVVKIVLADTVSLKENATNNTIFSFFAGLTLVVGPVIGGYLTAVSWRWCFIINIPIALLAMLAMFFLLRNELVGPSKPQNEKQSNRFVRFFDQLSTFDFGGLVLFLLGTGLIILATTWGGSTYEWSSVPVLVPLVVGSVLFVSFFYYEFLLEPGNYVARLLPSVKAMVPVQLFYKRDMALIAYINFAAGAAMYSIFYFLSIYFTIVQDYSPGKAGVQLLFYIPGVGVGVYLAVFMCRVYPKHTYTPLMVGSFIEALGMGLLILAISGSNVFFVNGMMILTGCGTGFRFMPVTLHITGLWPAQIASAISMVDFCLPFGGTVALAIMGAVFSNKLAGVVPGFSPSQATGRGSSGASGTGASNSSLSLAGLSSVTRDEVHVAVRQAIVWAFTSIIPILGLAVVAALFLGDVRITAGEKRTSEGHLDTAQDVVSEPYLLYLARGGHRKPGESLEEGVAADVQN